MITDQRKECDMTPCGKKGLLFTARMVPRRPQRADHTVGANNVLANRGRRVGGANRCRTTLSIISRQLDVRPLPVPTWAATINQQLRTTTTALAGKRVGGWGKARCCRSTLKLAVFDVHSLPSDDCLGSANYYNTQQLQAQNP